MLIALTIMVFLILVLLIMHYKDNNKDNRRILNSLATIIYRLDSQIEKQTNILDSLEKIEFNTNRKQTEIHEAFDSFSKALELSEDMKKSAKEYTESLTKDDKDE